jgi:2-C-methyl-D-erythritol 4-phosphate cytidylyltransferase
MTVVGVILAGGVGSRFGGALPKQFVKLAGREIIEHTVEIFDRSPVINEIVIVSQPDFAEHIWNQVRLNGWKKVSKIVNAGSDRMGSTRSAISSLSGYPDNTKVVLHDAVRPLLEPSVIANCCSMLDDFEAVDVVIPSADTIVSVQDNGCIDNIPQRALMKRGQTPQAFRLGTISSAYGIADRSGLSEFTCDCGVVRGTLPRVKVATVLGSESNIKVTTPLDLFLAEKLIQGRAQSSLADDISLADLSGRVIVVFGGGRGIGKSIRDFGVQYGAKVYIAGRSHNGIDVSDRDGVDEFLREVHGDAGRIDVVINTAAVLLKKPFDLLSDSEVSLMIDTNYLGAINVSLASRGYLLESRGCLIHFTSSSYTRGRAFYAIYSSTKSAVVNLTQALADEWADAGIRVNCINPERTKTPMRTEAFGEEDERTLLHPGEVAQATLRASLANYTGMIIDVRRSLKH